MSPDTIQRALALLRQEQLIILDRKQFFVTEDTRQLRCCRSRKAELLVSQLRDDLARLGYSWDDVQRGILQHN